MAIKSLAVRGLKNLDDFSLELSPITALMGPNGSGKSAILQALRLGLLGYDPETGKQLKDTRKLIAELSEAEISMSWDSDFGVRRRFGRSTSSEVLPSEGETTEKACQDRINRETGGLVVALDLSEFTGLSDEKRRAWLFEHLPRELATLDWSTFSMWTNAEAKDDLTDLRQHLWQEVVQKAGSTVDGIGAAVSMVHDSFLEADQARKDQTKVLAEAEKEATTAGETAGEFDAERLDNLKGALAGVNQRIGELRQKQDEITRARTKIENDRQEFRTVENQIAEMEATRNRLQRELGEKGNGTMGAEKEELTRRLEELAPKVEAGHDASLSAQEAYTEAKVEVRSHEGTLSDARQKLENLVALGAEGSCYTCGQPLGERFTQSVAAAEEDVKSAEEDVKSAMDGLGKATHDVEATAEIAYDLNQQRDEAVERIRSIDAELGARENLLERMESTASQLADLATRKEKLQRATTETPENAEDLDATLTKLYAEREGHESEIRSMDALKEAQIRAQVEMERVGKERSKLEAKEARAAALKELHKNLLGLRGHVIRQMIAPLHDEADAILRSVDPHKKWRFIFERENRDVLDFGFEEDGQFRSIDAASKGESALLAVAFIGALLAVLDPPEKFLVIDNLEAVDAVRRVRLMETLKNLQAEGRWDNVIVAGACDLTTVAGWTVVDMEKRPAAVTLIAA